MGLSKPLWPDVSGIITALQPEDPLLVFVPSRLQASARNFLTGFPGMVTYAVKANPEPAVIENLLAAGLEGFDVASIEEIELVRSISPEAALHFNNPVRSRSEIRAALARQVRSFSADSAGEIEKIADLAAPDGIEISVRFKLPLGGAAYDFGAKFGAEPVRAARLLRLARDLGFRPSLTFHPGTQCDDAQTWRTYVETAATIAAQAGVGVERLNVGGGFPAHRAHTPPDLRRIFGSIDAAMSSFGTHRPDLVCEPGRAMVADAFALVTRIRGIRDGDVFLNDGIYGGLAEAPILGSTGRFEVRSPAGDLRTGPTEPRRIFGPTCDSLDELPGPIAMPADSAEDDYVVFWAQGAYSLATTTRFNGFGRLRIVTAMDY